MGNYKNAYLTKQPNPVDPSEWINKQEEIGLYQQQLKDQKEQAEKDRTNKKFEGDFDGEYDMSSSGNGSIDGMLMQIGMQSLEQLKKAKEDGERAINTKGINSKEYFDAKQRYDNIMNRPGLMKLATGELKQTLNERQELLKTGNYIQDPNDIQKLNNFSTNPIKWKYSEDGGVLINSGENTSNLTDFTKSLQLGGLIPKIDEDSIIQTVTKSFKDKIDESTSGYSKTKTTNSWEDYKNSDGQKVMGSKTFLTQQYEDLVDDNFAKSVLASKGQWGYDDMTQETKDELKSNIINGMIEKSRPFIKEANEEDFDSAKFNALKTPKSSEETESGLRFVKSEKYGKGDKTVSQTYAVDIKNTGTGGSSRAANYDEVVFDEENRVIAVKGVENRGKDMDKVYSDYEKALAESTEAETALNKIDLPENPTEKQLKSPEYIKKKADYEKAEKLFFQKSDKVKLAKEKTTAAENDDKWSPITIKDPAKVLKILGPSTGAKSYEELQSILSREIEQPVENKETKKPVYKGLDEEGNPIFE